MICSYCTAEMPDISGFCPGCGRPVEATTSAPSAPALQDKLLGAVAYLGILPAIVLLLIPATRSSRFIRFHSWQGLVFVVSTAVLVGIVRLCFLILSILPVVGFLLSWLLLGVTSIAVAVLWVVLIIKAALGDSYELPFVGRLAARLAD
jgi:uncharacterized membrane protein